MLLLLCKLSYNQLSVNGRAEILLDIPVAFKGALLRLLWVELSGVIWIVHPQHDVESYLHLSESCIVGMVLENAPP
jgi:hypothetical protein